VIRLPAQPARAALLVAALAHPALAAPPEPAPVPPPPVVEAPAAWIAPEFAPPPEPGPPPGPDTPQGWLDLGHSLLAETALWPVVRLDRFFSDEREVDLDRPRSFVRLRNDLRLEDTGRVAYGISLRADLTVPSLDRRLRRLRLTISGERAGPLDGGLGPVGPVGPDDPDGLPVEPGGQATAGLRYLILDDLFSQTDAQAGVLTRLPPGVYVRLRYRRQVPLGEVLLARGSASGFWQTDTGWGTREDLDLERSLRPRLLLRLANTVTVTEQSRGWEWGSELSLIAALSPRAAASLGGAALGASDAGAAVETWRLLARYRRDVLRRWLFVELEPEGLWIRPPGGGRRRILAFTLRLEVQFDGSTRAGLGARGPGPWSATDGPPRGEGPR
jgi:hypothetical protein